MNKTFSLGNMTDEPKISTTANGKKVARFTLALNRIKEGADYPSFIAWEQKAEVIEKWCHKGTRLGIEGHIQTGSYEKDGRKVYTTDIVVDSIDFCDRKPKADDQPKADDSWMNIPSGFDEELPFN